MPTFRWDIVVGTGVLLRFGHARALTTIQVVIHSPYAASLPRLSVNTNKICSANLWDITNNPHDFDQIFHFYADSRGSEATAR